MKNVAIIIQKLNGGGAERTASNLSMCLSKHHRVHLIVFDGRNIAYPYEGTLHDLKIPPSKNRIGKFLNIYRRIAAVRKIKKEQQIDVSISLLDNANYVNAMSSINERIIVSVRNQLSKRKAIDNRTRNQLRTVVQKMDCLVSLSKGVEEDLIKNFQVPANKIVTIYNPCDGNLLKEKAKAHIEEAKEMSKQSLVTMGRLNSQKGQWHLLRAFSKVVAAVPEAKLYILGEGELGEKLRMLSENLGIQDNVVFKGFIESPHAFIMNSRAFVFSSLYEGLGNVILEAMACGTPVISTDCCSGPREIIAPDTSIAEHLDTVEYAEYGILTSVGTPENFNETDPITVDEEQLAEAMIKVLQDPACYQHYAEKSTERSQFFLPERITEQWLKVIG